MASVVLAMRRGERGENSTQYLGCHAPEVPVTLNVSEIAGYCQAGEQGQESWGEVTERVLLLRLAEDHGQLASRSHPCQDVATHVRVCQNALASDSQPS